MLDYYDNHDGCESLGSSVSEKELCFIVIQAVEQSPIGIDEGEVWCIGCGEAGEVSTGIMHLDRDPQRSQMLLVSSLSKGRIGGHAYAPCSCESGIDIEPCLYISLVFWIPWRRTANNVRTDSEKLRAKSRSFLGDSQITSHAYRIMTWNLATAANPAVWLGPERYSRRYTRSSNQRARMDLRVDQRDIPAVVPSEFNGRLTGLDTAAPGYRLLKRRLSGLSNVLRMRDIRFESTK